ncbi:MAG: DUF1987 domain-containing protein [Cytophagales bacterium]|nr:MAG: DUF1987 domain-containing protein [Cytophagales bacterium]
MNRLEILGTEDTPKVILDKNEGKFEISGRSLPEDAAEFYQPLIQWLDQYSKSPNESSAFEIKLEYFNTASSKLILDLLSKCEPISGAKVLWYFHKDDEDMQEAGEEFSELIELPFEIISY